MSEEMSEAGGGNRTMIIVVAIVVLLLLCGCAGLAAAWFLGDSAVELLGMNLPGF